MQYQPFEKYSNVLNQSTQSSIPPNLLKSLSATSMGRAQGGQNTPMTPALIGGPTRLQQQPNYTTGGLLPNILGRPNGRPTGVRNGMGMRPNTPSNPALGGMITSNTPLHGAIRQTSMPNQNVQSILAKYGLGANRPY